MKTKFQIGELLGIGMTLVVLGIGLAYGLQVMGETRDDIGTNVCADRTDGNTTFNASTQSCTGSLGYQVAPTDEEFVGATDAMTGVAKIPEKLPTIVTVIIAAVIIGILITYLWGRFSS
jgi:hypothetical protein